jgi:hypothetical protein
VHPLWSKPERFQKFVPILFQIGPEMNSSLPEEPAPIGLVTLFLDFVPKPWVAGRALTALTKRTHLKASLDSFCTHLRFWL